MNFEHLLLHKNNPSLFHPSVHLSAMNWTFCLCCVITGFKLKMEPEWNPIPLRNLLVSLCFNGSFSRWTLVSRYQNVSILDSVGAKDDGDGGDNWSYESCKALVKSSSPTPNFLHAKCPSSHPTSSVRALMGAWNLLACKVNFSSKKSIQLLILN